MFGSFEKHGAEAGLNWSQGLLIAFGTLLVIGLIGEWRKAKEERWQGWGDMFELMVIVGVAGELFFDGLIFGFSGRLDEIRDKSINGAEKVASTAFAVGNVARLKAGSLAVEVEILRGKNDQFEHDNQTRQKESDERHASLMQQLQQAKDAIRTFESRSRHRAS